MLNKLRERAQDEKGFTLIELLVVILIIGILAAIALPAFLNQREKAQDTEAKSAVRTAQTAMETYYTDNQTYTGADRAGAEGHRAGAAERQRPGVDRADRHGVHGGGDVQGPAQHHVHVHNKDGVVDRSCTPVQQGRLLRAPAAGSQRSTRMLCEAGLRARFVVLRGRPATRPAAGRPLKRARARADTSPVLKRNRSSKKTAIVGLELDPSHVAAAEVSDSGALTVTRGAVAPLRPGVIRDGEVADPEALTEALKALFAEHGFSRRVRLGVSNQRIVVRALDLPPLDDPKALAAAVGAEAPDHIPMPMDEAVVDFQSLGRITSAQGQERSRVVVVAVRREMIDRVVGAARDAGLQLEGIDLSAFAMVRAVGADTEEAVLYVNVAGLTNVAVANASGCLFTRASAGGLDTMVHTLCERAGLTTDHAREWLKHVGLATPLEEIEGDEGIVRASRSVLEDGVEQLADSVRNSLNFYRTQEGSERVERGVLTGPVVEIPGLVEQLAAELRLPLEHAAVGVEGEQPSPALLTVAAGLAIDARR